jgi:hypothetical protein
VIRKRSGGFSKKLGGAWGTDKFLKEVEAEIQHLRDEWDRLDRE